MKKIFVINGSASVHSANQKLVDLFTRQTKTCCSMNYCADLKTFPAFDPELSTDNPPASIIDLRKQIAAADGVLICTPEYVFSIPSGLKNIIEWCVATTVFSDKPVGLITASASGKKGHEELQLIMQTLTAKFNPGTTMLIQGVKGKIDDKGSITDEQTMRDFSAFIDAFKALVV